MVVRAIIADDHPMCREVARMALSAAVDELQAFEASTLEAVLTFKNPVDIILLDLGLPDSRGIASLIDVARERPGIPILVISGVDANGIAQQLAHAGAAGFVCKADPIYKIVEAIKVILRGDTYFDFGNDNGPEFDAQTRLSLLTSAESRVLRAMRDGKMNKQIAFDLQLSEITVKQHVKAILRKLGVANRTQAVLLLLGTDG